MSTDTLSTLGASKSKNDEDLDIFADPYKSISEPEKICSKSGTLTV